MNKILHVGLDVGSTTVKIVVMDDQLNTLYTNYQRHFSDTKNTVCAVLDNLLEKYPNSEFTIALTGVGSSLTNIFSTLFTGITSDGENEITVNCSNGMENKSWSSKKSKGKQISDAIRSLEDKMAGEGRVLIRPSGTEPLVRVMLEGTDREQIAQDAKELAQLIESKYA